MIGAETKRHIDSARQVLVGVVPNPTSQIDQITNALIYKFMDDMDQSAIKSGGDPSFFVGDLEPYAWTKIMSERLGHQERMNLYSEALVKFSQAKQLPTLFRDIFKSAFLPYRSPETLGLFLKEISYFDYAHPEDLGDAYEYLLSIMSSQGDAGQFRTPRNIIDFMVDVINPTKTDKILDPSCGTGGFLVSSYKHIVEQHDGKDDPEGKEIPLTPDDKRALFNNFTGYDIDPSMVRIAQVNMYLHQFKNPQIFQYDSLTQEERWNEKFDVILANPPFMSPQGGIRPHNKFSLPSTRSEVLFVDYIMNHLKPKGRAGIIVPEGIIFKSDTATKALRKALVEDGLYAVVSLPAGVFNPYAGVKTSILLFDNEHAKQSDELLFVKVENDGFDLGAQRRPINKNDLPEALRVLNACREGKKVESVIAQRVSRTKIAETGDYNLSASRYFTEVDHSNVKWPVVKIGTIAIVRKGQSITKKNVTEGSVPVIAGGQQPAYYHNESNREGDVITVSASGAYAGFVAHFWNPIFASDCSTVESIDSQIVLTSFIYRVLKAQQDSIYLLQKGGGQPHVYPKDIEQIKIPLPPLEVQQQIVKELDRYQKIIDGALQIVDNWKPTFIVDPEWQMHKFDEVCTLEYGSPLPTRDRIEGDYPVMGSNGISGYHNSFTVEGPAIIVGRKGSAGEVTWVDQDCYPIDTTYYIKPVNPDQISFRFLYYQLLTLGLTQMRNGAGVPGLNRQDVYDRCILAVPPLEAQNAIVETVEAERAHVESARALIDLYTQKIQSTIARLWSE